MTVLSYIGPGAGIALTGSLLFLLSAFGLAFLGLVSWPFRWLKRMLFLPKRRRTPTRRVIVVGLDGLDPERVRRLMNKGALPHLETLARDGTFSELGSTCPPISPVAWATFATGTNPGKHNIFDFLARDPKTYSPMLSSSAVRQEKGIFGARAKVESKRKSRPFWHVLGDYGVFSSVLRVPITFPPEPFPGLLLSAMCTPDLRGTQGSYTFFTEDPTPTSPFAGTHLPVTRAGDVVRGTLPGPAVESRGDRLTLAAPWELHPGNMPESHRLRIGKTELELTAGEYSEWVEVQFSPEGKRSRPRAQGICRFLLLNADPRSPFGLYVSPINIDPGKPALPVSHPKLYSLYFSKLLGPYATLGLAEDTWALNDGVLSDDAFLNQSEDIHAEREAMFFESLKRTRKGLCTCVFDGPDRVQHMFYRYDDPRFDETDRQLDDHSPIDSMYARLDSLVGRVQAETRPGDILFVISDHGFASFQRCVDLNAWLVQEGYLALKVGADKQARHLENVDWSKTKAYAFGLTGIYLNVRGREAEGSVSAQEMSALKREIAQKLTGLVDPGDGGIAIANVHDSRDVYRGPYTENAPDLIVGFGKGYRVSWECAAGMTGDSIFSDNDRAWSGDHCVDRDLVPGVLFSNTKIETPAGEAGPELIDLPPSILRLFGIDPPSYMDGRPLSIEPSPDHGGEKERQEDGRAA